MPQFYLRHFSTDGKRTNLFNFRLNRTIVGASIKHQCSRRNFYGVSPNLEKALAKLEGCSAEVIRGIRERAIIPNESSEDWALLLRYLVFQKLRTINAARFVHALTEVPARLIAGENPEDFYAEFSGPGANRARSVLLALMEAPYVVEVASGLRGHLFINTTRREFITSDDPVVLHNQYCERISYRGVLGWNRTGLQVFWPLSPQELIVLYDPETYRIGGLTSGRTVTKLSNERDIAQLNSLQIMNAHQNAYFAGAQGSNKAAAECRGLSPRRPRARMRFVQTEAVDNGEGELSEILHAYDPILPVTLSVSKIKTHRHRLQIPMHRRSGLQRKFIPLTQEERATHVNPREGIYPVNKITNV